MNPFHWRREHQVGLVLAMIIGAVVGTLVGYMMYAMTAGADGAVHFSYWSWTCKIFSSYCMSGAFSNITWTFLGAVLGAAVIYVRRLMAS
jgi:hypothetical protein